MNVDGYFGWLQDSVREPESHRILIDTQRALQHINYDDPEFQKACQHNIAVLQNGLDTLMVAAQRDLGIRIS